jgi:small subunit ribosomal protein S15
MKKSANLAKRDAQLQYLQSTQPDPLLGYHDLSIWQQSKLKQAILTKEQVWGTSNAAETSSRNVAASLDEGLDQDGAYTEPTRLNFGLDKQDAELLFDSLPRVASLRPVLASQSEGKRDAYNASRLEQLHEGGVEEETRKKEQLMRILDLKNANARGIRAENTQTLLEQFGRKEGDTGSPEVQGVL